MAQSVLQADATYKLMIGFCVGCRLAMRSIADVARVDGRVLP